jgi:propanol-preferring alcohol dehydrogenase
MVLHQCAKAEARPLRLADVAAPRVGPGEVRLRVSACGVCHTDLHLIEGDITPPRLPLVPGHQVVGVIEAVGPGVSTHREGERVGVPWLSSTDGVCDDCRRGQENLCRAARFTGFDIDGGYAELIAVPATSAHHLPAGFSDRHAAPLLCAGVIGYRSYRLSGVHAGGRLALFGFGGSAHIVLQLARHEGCEVFVATRAEGHRDLARRLGAAWTGSAEDIAAGAVDGAIVFAPAGRLVHDALRAVRRGGTVALAGITMSDIPPTPYALLYQERVLRSVANSTHRDVRELLQLAGQVPVQTTVETFPLEQANDALLAVKHSRIEAAAVLAVADPV